MAIRIFLILVLLAGAGTVQAENYVDFKGNFWIEIPADWEKLSYREMDYYLRRVDTSRASYDYEAAFAPSGSHPFYLGPYFVITFDSIGSVDNEEAHKILDEIGDNYSDQVYESDAAQLLMGLETGVPKINYEHRSVSVISELDVTRNIRKRLWQYMQLNDAGLVTFYFFAPDSTFNETRPVFEKVLRSLSFENLREAAKEEVRFTDIAGNESADTAIVVAEETSDGGSMTRNILLVAVVVIVGAGLIWIFVIRPKRKKEA